MVGSRRVTATAAVLVLVALAGAACSGRGILGGSDEGGDGGTAASTGKRDAAALQASGGAPARAAEARPSAAAQLPPLGPSVIKTASLVVEVAGRAIDRAVQDATQVAARYGGYVSSTTIDAGRAGRATVVMRVPSGDFERALGDVEGLGDVDERSVSGEDVSQQFVDLEARLRNWRAQEAVLLDLMERATSVTDTIRVQEELARVQLEIERLRGRLDYLEDQTAMATITSTFTAAAAAPDPPSTLARAWARALEAALATVAAVIVALGFALPPAALAAVVLLVIRAVRPGFGS